MKELSYEKQIAKVGFTTILWNVFLSLSKIITGFIAKSSSLISDGVHSASDVATTVIVMIGAKISQKAPDEDHPFGHERIESVTSIILAFILIATALLIGYSGVVSIVDFIKNQTPITVNSSIYIALSFAILSIIIKGWMYFYTIKAAKRINSSGLKADAYHHLTDSLSSIGSTLGIIGLIVGGNLSILDPIASIIIALCIVKVGIDICKDAIDQVVDKAAPEEFENDIKVIVSNNHDVINLNLLRTRQFGNKLYVEIEIAVDDNLTVKQGHDIAKVIHDEIEHKYPEVIHCMIHINPATDQDHH